MKKNSEEKVAITSLSEEQFIDLLRELQVFLKTKLKPCKNDQGVIHYWTCGVDHLNPSLRYEPFKNFAKFCTKKNLGWMEFKKRIEDHSGMLINCECYMVNHVMTKKP